MPCARPAAPTRSAWFGRLPSHAGTAPSSKGSTCLSCWPRDLFSLEQGALDLPAESGVIWAFAWAVATNAPRPVIPHHRWALGRIPWRLRHIPQVRLARINESADCSNGGRLTGSLWRLW